MDTGENDEHRQQWLEDKRLVTADTFALNICSYAMITGTKRKDTHCSGAPAAGIAGVELTGMYLQRLLNNEFLFHLSH